MRVSADMESLGHGGFQFKETVMSGHSLNERGELKKVLGLRWDTEKDEICVDIKLKFGEKIKGYNVGQDTPLTDPEVSQPDWIKRRVLWQVAQS
jgi:hypothetical protein